MSTKKITLPLPIREEIESSLKVKRATWSLILTELPHIEVYEDLHAGVRLSLRWTLFITPENPDSSVRVVTFCEWEPLDEDYFPLSTKEAVERERLMEARCALHRTSTIPMTRENARNSWGQEIGEGGKNITSRIEPLNA